MSRCPRHADRNIENLPFKKPPLKIGRLNWRLKNRLRLKAFNPAEKAYRVSQSGARRGCFSARKGRGMDRDALCFREIAIEANL